MDGNQPKVYAVKHKKEKTRAVSRSGGVFTAISDWVLANKGVVYGCILSKDFEAVHIRADHVDGRNRMRGSKYIPSRLGNTFRNVQADLFDGRRVLFTGTSCQIAGLKGFLKKDYDNLICMDIICHGVPSPKVWFAYLEWQEKRYGAKVNDVDFRNKQDFGWHEHIETFSFDNGKKVSGEIFKNLFFGHMILRPSCYVCPYKSIVHPGDITIGDYWGIEKAAPEFDDNKGVSIVLINTNIGEYVFNAVKNKVMWKATRIEDSMQMALKEAVPKPSGREQFWNEYYAKNFGYIVRKYGGIDVISKLKSRFRKIKRKLVEK